MDVVYFKNIKESNLGIKVVMAKDTVNKSNFAIIADVNPGGFCYSESILPGDILLSVNGLDFNSLETYNTLLNNNVTINQISIKKNGILDCTDLFKRCINSPCSELCEKWNNTSIKLSMKSATNDNKHLPLSDPVITFKCAKPTKTDENNTNGNIGGTTISSKLLANNNPKIKFHQKATPISKSKNSPVVNEVIDYNVTFKPIKHVTKEIIISRQPRFVKRIDAKWYNMDLSSNLKQAQSLNDITDICDGYQSSENISSFSHSPLTSKLKSGLSVENLSSKPIPLNILKPRKLSHKRSFEVKNVFYLNPDFDDDNEFIIKDMNGNTANQYTSEFQDFKETYKPKPLPIPKPTKLSQKPSLDLLDASSLNSEIKNGDELKSNRCESI